jgi:hypothetical protein
MKNLLADFQWWLVCLLYERDRRAHLRRILNAQYSARYPWGRP